MTLDVAGAEGSSEVPTIEINASEILAKIQEGQEVEYDHIIVRGDLDLSRKRLRKNITAPIRINDSIFYGSVSFHDTTLEKSINLSGSNFTRDAYFIGSRFSGDAYSFVPYLAKPTSWGPNSAEWPTYGRPTLAEMLT